MKNKLEKTIMMTMNNVIAFIKKAMDNNLDISTIHSSCEEYGIEILINNNDTNRKYCNIRYFENSIIIHLGCNSNNIYIKDISKQDLLLFKLLFLDVEEYSNKKSLEYFNNFFKKEDDKQIGVDDLDDDDLDDDK